MIKFIAGFFFAIITLAVWSAFSQVSNGTGDASKISSGSKGDIPLYEQAYINSIPSARTPNGKIVTIKVDEEGRVICAPPPPLTNTLPDNWLSVPPPGTCMGVAGNIHSC